MEVGGVEHEADVAFAVQRLGHQVSRRDAVAVLVRRHDADIVLAGTRPFGAKFMNTIFTPWSAAALKATAVAAGSTGMPR